MNSGAGMRRARAIGALAVLLGTVIIVRLADSSPTESATPAAGPLLVSTTCADLVVLGLRGSGQSTTGNAGVGQEVFRSVRSLAAQVHAGSDSTVRLEAVDYPSAPAPTYDAYLAGVQDGDRMLGARFAKLAQDCPDSRFAFIGFSQGAHVVHEFAHALSAEQVGSVVLVAMIADPRRNPDDTITTWAYGGRSVTHGGRLGAGPGFDAGTRRAAITLCAAADEVCNRPDGDTAGATSETHRHFYEKAGNVRSTGRQLVAVLHRNGFS
jgi:cutinase